MFTTSGKNIISKYMLGQVPAFGSYIAIGCGAVPLGPLSQQNYGYDISRTGLIFETARARIISKGYVNDGTSSNMVLTAELPTDERYEITEIGLFPSQMNDAAGSADSKILLKFNNSEAWTKNGTNQIPGDPGTLGDKYSGTVKSNDGIISETHDATADHNAIQNITFVNSDNPGLNQDVRVWRQERPRFLNQSIFIRANSTDHIVLSGLNIDLSQNAPTDILSLAYSILSDSQANSSIISAGSISMVIKLMNSDSSYYTMTVTNPEMLSSTSRYDVRGKIISDLVPTGTPSLKNINMVQISLTTTLGTPADYWVALDGFRLDAPSFNTAVYDLVAYKQIKNSAVSDGVHYPVPIVKDANTLNYIEFRFNIGLPDSGV